MKIWHDDVRPPPIEWIWAHNNEQARVLLTCLPITIISLDHDLGALPSDGIYAKGFAEETGLHLVEWMIAENLVPETVIIHSWNAVGTKRMQQALVDAGHWAEITPFTVDA